MGPNMTLSLKAMSLQISHTHAPDWVAFWVDVLALALAAHHYQMEKVRGNNGDGKDGRVELAISYHSVPFLLLVLPKFIIN